MKEATDKFGPKSLIGEGSYGQVYYSVLRRGRTAAIKKLDTSKQPDQEFLAQVRHSNVKLKGFYLSSPVLLFLLILICQQINLKPRYLLLLCHTTFVILF